MASEMIERAAKAAAEAYGHDWAELPVENPIANGEHDRAMFVEMMTAVLQAIREPSQHMLSDGAFQIFRGERITEDDLAAAGRVWRAMTKAALAG